MQIDTGTIFLEHEPSEVLTDAIPFAVHAHVTEPDLQPIGVNGLKHAPSCRGIEWTAAMAVHCRSKCVPSRIGARQRPKRRAFVRATYR